MNFISTRGQSPVLDFEAVTLAGLARDGGLYVPASIPRFSPGDLRALAGLSYVDTAVRVLLPFMGGRLDEPALRALLTQAYGSFHHKAIAPLRQLDAQHWLLELFHGPTLAFKDFALQVLGHLFELFLAAGDRRLTVVGATSGDTGSAAINALAGRDHVDIVMLHPLGRVSEVQRRQMTTIMAPNVYNVAIEGTFDDCQALVKAMFRDAAFRDAQNLSAVNSINWTRLMVQVVYYIYAGVRLGAPDRAVAFSVPTGNFGDVFAGYVAAQMGLPVRRLVVATNSNDILHRAMTQGDYSVGTVVQTSAPSMDIQVSSNFERLLFDLYGRDGARTAQMMADFESTRQLAISEEALVDPHTAIGLAAAWAQDLPPEVPVVTLATAHPAKFRTPVERATGHRPSLPAHMSGLFDREERFVTLANDLATVQRFVATKEAA